MYRQFIKENIRLTNKHLRRYSVSLAIGGMQSKTTVRYHFIPTKMILLKKADNYKCWQGYGETETFTDC